MSHHGEPPWRTLAIKDDRDKEKLKTQGAALQWLDGASRWYNREKLGTPGKKEEQLKSRILMNLRNKELITWMKQE